MGLGEVRVGPVGAALHRAMRGAMVHLALLDGPDTEALLSHKLAEQVRVGVIMRTCRVMSRSMVSLATLLNRCSTFPGSADVVLSSVALVFV